MKEAHHGHQHHANETSAEAHAGHTPHDKHTGHSVEMFRRKFWGTLLLSIPTVIWAPTIQHWLGVRHDQRRGGPSRARLARPP